MCFSCLTEAAQRWRRRESRAWPVSWDTLPELRVGGRQVLGPSTFAQSTGTWDPAHRLLGERAVRRLLGEQGARLVPRRAPSLARGCGIGSTPEWVGLSSNPGSGTLCVFPLCRLVLAAQPPRVTSVTRCPVGRVSTRGPYKEKGLLLL